MIFFYNSCAIAGAFNVLATPAILHSLQDIIIEGLYFLFTSYSLQYTWNRNAKHVPSDLIDVTRTPRNARDALQQIRVISVDVISCRWLQIAK